MLSCSILIHIAIFFSPSPTVNIMGATSSLRADLYNALAIPTSKTLPDGSVGLW